MRDGWQAESDTVEKQRKAAWKKWEPIRDKGCPENRTGPCVCSTLPRYKELVLDVIEPLTKQSNALWMERATAEKAVYQGKLDELKLGREARKKYRKERQKSSGGVEISLAARSCSVGNVTRGIRHSASLKGQ